VTARDPQVILEEQARLAERQAELARELAAALGGGASSRRARPAAVADRVARDTKIEQVRQKARQRARDAGAA
jgi:hypothetical protein